MSRSKLLPALLFAMLCFSAARAQKMIGNETDAQKQQRMAWWTDAAHGIADAHWQCQAG